MLARAGTHMEHTMVGAYLALLLGNMAVAAPAHALAVRARVPRYEPMLPTLRKYFDFLTLTASVSHPYIYLFIFSLDKYICLIKWGLVNKISRGRGR